jgi:hypothetical protein
MGLYARTWLAPRQRAGLWERWKNGQCVADIARALRRKNKSGAYRILLSVEEMLPYHVG